MTNNELKELVAKQTLLISKYMLQFSTQDQQITKLTETIGKSFSVKSEKNELIINKGNDNDMTFYIPKGCSFFQRKDNGRWEGRIMINGKQKFIASSKKKGETYKKMMQAYKENKKKPIIKQEKELTLFAWLDQWHEVFRKPKEAMELSKNTILTDLCTIRKIKKVFKDIKLKDITGDYVQKTLNSMDQGRTCENVYTTLKLALDKAKDRTGGLNIMSLVEKPRHERVKGRALIKDEIAAVLNATQNDIQQDITKFYIYTGCRVSELVSTLVEFVNLTDQSRIITNLKYKGKAIPDMTLLPNEVLIYGTKTKGSIRTMPIMPPLRPVLEKLIADRDGKEKLFKRYTTVMIRNFYAIIKDKTKINFTLKDFRHTAATSFKDAGIPSSVYFRWFGWTDETMARRVYTHETEYEKKLSQEWAKNFK